MPIKSLDKLIPGGDFSLIDLNDVDLKVDKYVDSAGYSPGASPADGSKLIVGMTPASMHTDITSKMSGVTISGLTQNDIIQYSDTEAVYTLKFDSSSFGEGMLCYNKDTNKFLFYEGTSWSSLDTSGSCGPQGVIGQCGPQGLQGSCGTQGSCGPQGDIGQCGPQGDQGTQGSCGSKSNNFDYIFGGNSSLNSGQFKFEGVGSSYTNTYYDARYLLIHEEDNDGSNLGSIYTSWSVGQTINISSVDGNATYKLMGSASESAGIYTISIFPLQYSNQSDQAQNGAHILQLGLGSDGSCGPQGDQGTQGQCGPQGDLGPCGNKGDLGQCGPQGGQGNQGGQGSCGPQGVIGQCGPQGVIGQCGPQGGQGNQGNQGFQGPCGTQGVCGPQGSCGFQGGQGNQGSCGTQGQCGPQGNQGSQGKQGLPSAITFSYSNRASTTPTLNGQIGLIGGGAWNKNN